MDFLHRMSSMRFKGASYIDDLQVKTSDPVTAPLPAATLFIVR